jgi:hypothetical protein
MRAKCALPKSSMLGGRQLPSVRDGEHLETAEASLVKSAISARLPTAHSVDTAVVSYVSANNESWSMPLISHHVCATSAYRPSR